MARRRGAQPEEIDNVPAEDEIIDTPVVDEMSTSFMSYAMSVIISRALPDVRDGLKPVHRRILFSMHESNLRPDRSYVKCARVVGDAMGKYHPHGDSAIYDALVRMAQDFSMRVPTIDGHGNFGTHADGAAAMRYSMSAATRVLLADGSSPTLGELSAGLESNSEMNVDLLVAGWDGRPVHASKMFNSGVHPMLVVETETGRSAEGTYNHPVLCLVDVVGVPLLLWKRFDELKEGDWVASYRGARHLRQGYAESSETDIRRAVLAGGLVAEGYSSARWVGFDNTDLDYFDRVTEAWHEEVGHPVFRTETTVTGKTLFRVTSTRKADVERFKSGVLGDSFGKVAREKRIPSWVWSSAPDVKAAFLASAWTGDGSVSVLTRNSIHLSYSTYSRHLARDMQQMLLEFGIASGVCSYAGGEYKVFIGNRSDASLFAGRVGFIGSKHQKLVSILADMPTAPGSLGADYVPFVSDYLKSADARKRGSYKWLRSHNVDRVRRWAVQEEEILQRINAEGRRVVERLMDGTFRFEQVRSIRKGTDQAAYSLRIDTEDHAYVTDGFISHNTECRMAPAAVAMAGELGEATVDFADNYDGKLQEPTVLPARYPNLLVNGSTGIAVGMATNMAPHNLIEVVEACKHMLANPNATTDELIEFIPAPDFPTGGLLVGNDGAKEAYRTGKGQVIMRARTETIDVTARKRGILVTELPYQVGPEKVMARIKEVKDAKKLDAVTGVVDLSDRKHGLRLVIELRSGVDEKKVLRDLFRLTPLQESFSIHNLALVGGVPKTLTLRELVQHYVDHRMTVTRRRTEYRKLRAEEKAHLLEGYLLALASIDEVVAVIRASKDTAMARTKLCANFEMTDIQATAVLEMPLRRLTSLEVNKIKSELAELKKTIKELAHLLANDKAMRALVAAELDEVALELGTPRRTSILGAAEMAKEAEAAAAAAAVGDDAVDIADEPTIAWLTSQGMLGRAPSLTGKPGKMDAMDSWLGTSTRAKVGIVTNQGRVHYVPVYELVDAAGSKSRGVPVSEVVELEAGEKAVALIDPTAMVALATAQGLIKRVSGADMPKKTGQELITLKDGDLLVGAYSLPAGQEDAGDLVLVSSGAQLLRTPLSGINPKGAKAGGMGGMKLAGDDQVIASGIVLDGDEAELVTVTDKAAAKVTAMSEYPVKGRGGQGVRCHKLLSGEAGLAHALVSQAALATGLSSSGALVALPAVKGKRDGSGTPVDGLTGLAGLPPKPAR